MEFGVENQNLGSKIEILGPKIEIWMKMNWNLKNSKILTPLAQQGVSVKIWDRNCFFKIQIYALLCWSEKNSTVLSLTPIDFHREKCKKRVFSLTFFINPLLNGSRNNSLFHRNRPFWSKKTRSFCQLRIWRIWKPVYGAFIYKFTLF